MARHFANLMMRQAGGVPINFDSIASERKLQYFAAIRAAVGRDYDPIRELFEALIDASGKPAGDCVP